MGNVTHKQLTANRRNARQGGIKTVEGKQKIRFNARKHGILANILANYENEFHQNYVDHLFDEFKPQNTLEELLVERIAIHYLKLFRLSKAEGEHIRFSLKEKVLDFSDSMFDDEDKMSLSNNQFETLLNLYQRYETTTENRLYRALKELKELRSPEQMGLFGNNA
ncbi:MAG: hypothetical protein HRT90_05480 [Candidatus Margulisbacteria bacterium]|nr:hypothetical protein [Candidatus Margulisiibacteriota bacterium]